MSGIEPRIKIEEVDGSPSGRPRILKIPNGILLDNQDGSYKLGCNCRGLMYVSTSGIVTISTGGTYQKVSGGNIAYTSAELLHFTHNAGRLTYTETHALVFIVTAFISIESGETAQDVSIRIAQTGPSIAGTTMERDFNAVNRPSALGVTWILELVADDYVELFCTSDANSDEIIINNLTFSIRAR